jgi:hypothetical protein
MKGCWVIDVRAWKGFTLLLMIMRRCQHEEINKKGVTVKSNACVGALMP